MKKILLCAFGCLVLSACADTPLPTLPVGEQVIEGVLVPAPISLHRRGSHTIVVDGNALYFVESKSVNLRTFEQKTVILRGTVERNTEPTDLPVLLVSSVEQNDEETKQFPIPSLGLTLVLPADWDARIAAERIFVIVGDITIPLLRLHKEALGEKSFTEFLEQYPLAVPIVLQGRAAARINDEVTGNQTVYVLDGTNVITLLFTPSGHSNPDILRSQFLRILQTMIFAKNPSVQNSSSVGSQSSIDSAVGQPCGGPAGVLCPQGFYCSITDFGSGIGRCNATLR